MLVVSTHLALAEAINYLWYMSFSYHYCKGASSVG